MSRFADGKPFTRLASALGREGSQGANLLQGPTQSVEDFEVNAGLRHPNDTRPDAEHRQQVSRFKEMRLELTGRTSQRVAAVESFSWSTFADKKMIGSMKEYFSN